VFVLVFSFSLCGCSKRKNTSISSDSQSPDIESSDVVAVATFCPAGKSVDLEENSERRAAFDIGSGSIKLKIKDVVFLMDNTSYSDIINGSHHRRVDFQAALAANSNYIPPNLVEQGIKALKELKIIAQALGATKFNGVATGAFRKAVNGEEVLQELSNAVKVSFLTLSSDEEAAMAFEAANTFSKYEPENLIVWDIGASTMSMSGLSLEGELEAYEGDLASIGLRDDIMKSIQGKLNDKSTPNPLAGNEADVAVILVQSEAQRSIPRSLIERITLKNTIVAGVGPVHSLSVNRQLNSGESYTVENVEKALYRNLNLSDEEIGGKFADTDVVNLILVLGFMRGLGIKEVSPVAVNIADGLIQNENYWR